MPLRQPPVSLWVPLRPRTAPARRAVGISSQSALARAPGLALGTAAAQSMVSAACSCALPWLWGPQPPAAMVCGLLLGAGDSARGRGPPVLQRGVLQLPLSWAPSRQTVLGGWRLHPLAEQQHERALPQVSPQDPSWVALGVRSWIQGVSGESSSQAQHAQLVSVCVDCWGEAWGAFPACPPHSCFPC